MSPQFADIPGGLAVLIGLVVSLALVIILCRHAVGRAYARWKTHRDRTRVRREYWGYE